MILCPALKVKGSPDYDPSKPLKPENVPPSRAISWNDCVRCKHNRDSNKKAGTVECGFDPQNVVTLESVPV